MTFIPTFQSLPSDIEKLIFIENLQTTNNFKKEEMADGLLEIITTNDNPIIRHEAAFHLAQLNSSLSLDKSKIIRQLHSILICEKSVVVRHEILECLGFFNCQESVAVLSQFIHDSDDDIAQSAVLSLERISLANVGQL